MMIDCASNPKTDFSPVSLTKRIWGDTLGYLIISHPHMDHISDIENIQSFKPVSLLRPEIDYSILLNGKDDYHLDIINKYIEFQEPYVDPVKPPNAPTKEWRDEVIVENFHLKGEQTDLNDSSYVTFITYGNFHYASAGDLTTNGWERLIEQEGDSFTKKLFDVDFFQASHHGRKEGFNQYVLEEMNPFMVFVSDKYEQDTSVTERYYEYCKGWDVTNENSDEVEKRYVVTTRADGRIKINASINDGTTYVSVYTK